MTPDENFSQSCQETERVKLEEKLKDLSEEQKQNIFKTGLL
jgi:Zn-dependent M16 (insulinase) family peptidase